MSANTTTATPTLQTLQEEVVTLIPAWEKFLKGEDHLGVRTSDTFKNALRIAGPKKDKSGAPTDSSYGLEEVMIVIFSGDKKLIPAKVRAILDAKRPDKYTAEDGPVTIESKIKNRWAAMLSDIQRKQKEANAPTKDEVKVIMSNLDRLLKSERRAETIAALTVTCEENGILIDELAEVGADA
jgi:hypothetical protein